MVTNNLDLTGEPFEEGMAKPTPDQVDLMYAVKLFENLSAFVMAKALDLDGDGDHLATLRLAYLSPGDLLYIPAGVLMIEKSLNANSIAMRVPVTFVDEITHCKLERVQKAGQGCPGINFVLVRLGLGIH